MDHVRKLQMVRVVLHWGWDPIGIRNLEDCLDEYDMYAPDLLALLEAGAPAERIADHLTGITRFRMGLGINAERDGAAATMLQQLYAIVR